MFIYRITNNINGKIYIGMDSGPVEKNRRWKYHCSSYLKSHVKDYEKVLYQAMRKYGLENFTYDIIEQCASGPELKKRETYWIKALNSTARDRGYNKTHGGDGGSIFAFASVEEQQRLSAISTDVNNRRWAKIDDIGRKAHGQKVVSGTSPESQENRRQITLKRWNDMSKEKRQNLANLSVEWHKNADKEIYEERNKKIGKKTLKALSWTYLAIAPSGEQFVVEHLKSFCKIHGLVSNLMSALTYGKRKHHHKWLCFRIIDGIVQPIPDNIPITKKRFWKLVSPDNVIYEIKSMKSFCKENSLSYEAMKDVWYGYRENYQGWTIADGPR